jgi:hypothetical protein
MIITAIFRVCEAVAELLRSHITVIIFITTALVVCFRGGKALAEPLR